MKYISLVIGACAFAVGSASLQAQQTSSNSPSTLTTGDSSSMSTADTRHGLFNGLDSRSVYGQGAFPEPFLIDDSDLEVNEARLDWLHTGSGGGNFSDVVTAEVEKGFGPLTLEIEVPFERDASPDGNAEGFANIDLGARIPFYQFVSRSGFADTTFGAAVEVGIPSGSPVSKDTELVPKLFNDTKLGNITLQTIIGYSALFGPGDDGGSRTFEYGLVSGYAIDHKCLPIPGVQQLIPIFEVSGETALNHDNPGQNSLVGNAAIRANLKTILGVQPRLGLGYVFPLNNTAREDLHWGIFTSLVFEY